MRSVCRSERPKVRGAFGRFLIAVLGIVAGGCFEPRVPAMLTCGVNLPACPQNMTCTTAGRCVPVSNQSCLVAEGADRIGALAFYEDFEALGNTGMWTGSSMFENWRGVYNGTSIEVEDDPQKGKVLAMNAPVSSGFVITNRSFSNVDFSVWVRFRTINPDGFVALAWNVQTDLSSYHLALRMDRWSMFGHDGVNHMDTPETGDSHNFTLNRWYHVRMVQQGAEMRSYLCSDTGTWTMLSSTPFTSSQYASGPIGLVSTSATVDVDEIRVFQAP